MKIFVEQFPEFFATFTKELLQITHLINLTIDRLFNASKNVSDTFVLVRYSSEENRFSDPNSIVVF